jgi:prevent-host-death family protein
MTNAKATNDALLVFGATEAKNEFGKILEIALQKGAVAITRHGRVRAVLMSVEAYEALQPRAQLDALTAEFDALLERMQSPDERAAVTDVLRMSGEELGAAAVARARG